MGTIAIDFLSRDEAVAALMNDDGEPYYSRMNPREAAVKTNRRPGTLVSEDAVRAAYSRSVREFHPSSARTLEKMIDRIAPHLAALPLAAGTPWRLALVEGPLEGGASFTRADTIFLSGRGLGQLLVSRQPTLLLHEHCHVAQRLHRERFARLYPEVLGFVRLEPSVFGDASQWLSERHLLNPDALDWWAIKDSAKWLAPAHIMPRRRAWSGLRDALLPTPMWAARRAGLELVRQGEGFRLQIAPDGEVAFTDLGQLFGRPAAFSRSFSLASDHPNEVTAHLWTGVVFENAKVHGPKSASG